MVGYIYSGAKNRRSGGSMQKRKSLGDWKKWRQNREVLPGFPAQPFERVEDIELYISGDKLPCLICGRQFKRPIMHTVRIHEVDEQQYRVMFNIPSRFSLSAPDMRENLAERMRRLNAEGRMKHGYINALASRKLHGIRKPAITALGMQSHVNRIKSVNNTGRHGVKTDCKWHLKQVAEVYRFRAVTPPEGELSWDGYKKRRLREPDLQAAHVKARECWKTEKRKKGLPND